MGLLSKWRIINISDEVGVFKLIRTLRDKWTPIHIAIDTETTGLNLASDVPFMASIAFNSGSEYVAVSIYSKDIPEGIMRQFYQEIYDLTSKGFVIMHNATYDLNMIHNYGVPINHGNILDTQTLIRLCTPALVVKKGGAPLSLKDYATRYLDPRANELSKALEKERQVIAAKINKTLKLSIKGRVTLEEAPNDSDDLDEQDRQEYFRFYNSIPPQIQRNMRTPFVLSKDVPFNMLPKALLEKYAAYDAIFTFEIFESLYPSVDLLEVRDILNMEMQLAKPLYLMVREGFVIDKAYVAECRDTLKKYIKDKIQYINLLHGSPISVNQHAKIKEYLHSQGLEIPSTADENLVLLVEKLKKDNTHHEVVSFIESVQELRTLLKWYTTYLMNFYKESQKADTIYAGMNPAGAVTGRFTSSFQQFPKDSILDDKGNVLFTPRKMIIPKEGELLLFVDYSQIELRIQAMYTYLLEDADLNLCRAYMPYQCHHYLSGETYNPSDHEHIIRWDERQPDGISAWLTDESSTPWVPTDLHAKTTEGAFPDVPVGTPEFKKLRNTRGKPANFACNYGAKTARIYAMFPEVTWEEADRIYQAYRTAFPGVIKYQRWCYSQVNELGFGTNLFGRKYYGIAGHNYANAAIQGTGADLLKKKMIEISEFLKPYKTRLKYCVHDELIFSLDPSEAHIIQEIVNIMEDLPNSVVPIVAESEISDTNWAEKRGYTIENGLIKLKGDKK